MDKHLKDCLSILNDQTQKAVSDGRINGQPFVAYADQAAHIFAGFETVIQIIEVNRLMESDTAEGGDAAKSLTPYESGALLSMMRAMSNVMLNEAERLAGWATSQEKQGRAKA